MAEPLKIRFATDHSAAKSGMQDLAASVVANMIKVSDAMNTGIQANGGYAATVRTLSANVVNDFLTVGKAGLKAANDSNYSAVATVTAMARASEATQTHAVIAKGAYAVYSESAKFHLGIVRNEAKETLKALATSPAFMGAASAIGAIIAFKVTWDLTTASFRAASEALGAVVKLGEDAGKLGVSSTFLQTYSAHARAAKVDVDDLRKALEMAQEAFTVKLGEGGQDARNSSAFAARLRQHVDVGNVTQDQLDRFAGARGTEEKFRVALDVIAELQAKSRDLAALDLAAKIFPPELVQRIRQGTLDIDKLRKTIDDVKNPDLVFIRPDDITRAQELQRRLDEAKATLDKAGAEWNRMLVDGGEQLKRDAISWTEIMARGAAAAISILSKTREAGFEWHRSGAGLSSGGTSLGAELGAHAGRKAEPKTLDEQQREDALNLLRGNLGNQTLVKQAQQSSSDMLERFRSEDGRKGVRDDQSKPISAKEKSNSAKESFDAVETFINSLEKSVAALKAETEAFGKSNAEKAAAINLAKLRETADQQGITLTEAQIAKTRAAAEATATYKDKLQDLEQQERQTADAARHFGNTLSDALGDALLEGKSLQNILLDISKMMVRGGIQALMTGQGPLAGILGTAPAASQGGNAVGGLASIVASVFRANGGPVTAGRPYTVGEMGQEIFVPDSNGRVMPISRGGLGGMGGPAFQIIDQRTMAAPAPEVRRGPGGSMQVFLRDMEGAIGQRAARGQGAFAGALSGPATRKG